MGLFGCTTNPVRRCDDCVDEELNRVIHAAMVRKNTAVIDTTTPALFASTLLAAELACNAIIIRNVNGTKDAPSVQEGRGAGKQNTRILAKQHTLSFVDFNYIKNVVFWNDFENASQNYDLYYFTDSYGWSVTNTRISASAADPITDDNTTYIEGLITIKWSQKGNPLPHLANTDALEACQLLFDYDALAGFVNRSGSTAIITKIAITNRAGDRMSIGLDTNVVLTTVSVDEGTLPSGLTLSIQDQGIIIAGTVALTTSAKVTIRASNACGISGQFDLTINII